MRLIPHSVNHRLPSELTAMRAGWLLAVLMGYSDRTPLVDRDPIRLPPISVNHRLPSRPATIASGPLFAVRPNSTTLPAVVMRATLSVLYSVNHRLLSGPERDAFDGDARCNSLELFERTIRNRVLENLAGGVFGNPKIVVGTNRQEPG
jgi:hypothetical protein